ncbi:MAG: beta-galactosidase [Patescibacteria group bacterium]|nr:beta-galactosidase [Patescibacteria group bacterium]
MAKTFFGLAVRVFFRAIVAIVLLVGVLLIAFNFPVESKNGQMEFGISFSNIQARALELDWKETYIQMLEDLRPKRVRIGAYWTEIEQEDGSYDFSDLDWQVTEAQKRDTELILVFGIKVPRWPECHIPERYKTDKQGREDALMKYEKAIVERYKDYENIKVWQVENEPFLNFGDCIKDAVDTALLDREIAQVRELDDSRPIMITDSGELSIWIPVARRADVFGTTLYRIIYKEPFGYVEYPLGPAFFRIKGWLIKTFAGQENVVVSELQAEPWGTAWLPHMTIEEQYVSMNPEKFQEIIEYTQKTNFSEAYLWGVEWWYWLKVKKDIPDMWEEARKVMTQRQ